MSTKKRTTKQKGGEVSARLRQRAEKIIGNTRRYDAITRQAIKRALTEQHADLADCLTRAERGELINDLTAAQVAARTAQDDLQLFAYHFAAALKIAREDNSIPAHLYNDLATAWNDFTNTIPSVGTFHESLPYIALALDAYAAQTDSEGGAK